MYNIILNPMSGEGKKKKLHKRALARFSERGADFRVFETEKAGQASLLAHELSQEEGDIVVIGGDGTLHEALNGMSDFEHHALGLIPAGTGNDFAAAAKIPLEPEKAVDLILDTQPKLTEFMQMPKGVRGINLVGTGIDVEILKRCRSCAENSSTSSLSSFPCASSKTIASKPVSTARRGNITPSSPVWATATASAAACPCARKRSWATDCWTWSSWTT